MMTKKSEVEPAKASAHVATLLSEAKKEIDAADQALASADEAANRHYRAAADHIAKAQTENASQRQIARGIGKSASWVNQLLRWSAEGYRASPFGPQSSAARARKKERSGATEHGQKKAWGWGTTGKTAKEKSAEAKAATREAKAEAEKAEADAASQGATVSDGATVIKSKDRERLVKTLAMMSSDQDGECLNAARQAEKLRKSLGLTWDELLVSA